jgi:hypothetical protein
MVARDNSATVQLYYVNFPHSVVERHNFPHGGSGLSNVCSCVGLMELDLCSHLGGAEGRWGDLAGIYVVEGLAASRKLPRQGNSPQC